MLTLKKIQYLAGMSQETHCYSADLYLDGKRVGQVGNAGHGGCDEEHFINEQAEKAVRAYIDTLPEVDSQFGGTLKMDLEWICSDLVNDYLAKKELKKLLSKRVIWILDGKLWQTNTAGNAAQRDKWVQEIERTRKEGQVILNSMPFNDALKLFNEVA